MRRRATALAAAALLAPAVTAASSAVAGPATAEPGRDTSSPYEVYDVRTAAQRNAIASTGAAIDSVEHAVVEITATGSELRALRALGFTVRPAAVEAPAGEASTLDFPSSDALYHNYAEMVAEVNATAAQYPAIAQKRVLGKTYQGRDIVALKISDNVATDENEPEILYDSGRHRRPAGRGWLYKLAFRL